MKRALFLVLCTIPLGVLAQVTIFTEDFDNYNDQDYAGVVSQFMSTWSGNTGPGTDDIFVTSLESNSPSNSIVVTGGQSGGTQDGIIRFPADYTSGRFEFSMKYKVAAGKGAYFNLQSSGANPGTAWMAEVLFAADGTGSTRNAGFVDTFTYTNGAWIDVMIDCDIDNDMAYLWIDGDMVGTGFTWSTESNGFGNGDNDSFGGVNLFALSGDTLADCEYYVDDLLLIETTGMDAGLNEEVLTPSVQLAPNPSNGSFSVLCSNLPAKKSMLTLTDVFGKRLYTEHMNITDEISLPFNMSLKNGIYFVTIDSGNFRSVRKLIIKR